MDNYQEPSVDPVPPTLGEWLDELDRIFIGPRLPVPANADYLWRCGIFAKTGIWPE